MYLISDNAEFKYPNLKQKITVLLDYFIKSLIITRRFNFTIIYFNECKFFLNSIYFRFESYKIYDKAIQITPTL
jgi:hypothetical protein